MIHRSGDCEPLGPESDTRAAEQNGVPFLSLIPIEIRRFRQDDIPTLFALFRDTIHRVNCRDYSPEQIRAWAPEEINTARWTTLADRFTVVAEVSGQVAGFADLESDGHVDRFFVQADRQRQGVGHALLAALTAEAGRAEMCRLFAEVSITARPFFERHGFIVLAEQVVRPRGVPMVNFRMERRLR